MKVLPVFLGAVVSLAAGCSGQVVVGGGGTGAPSGPKFANSAADTFQSKMTNGGVSGTMATINSSSNASSTRDVVLVVSNDYQTAYLNIDGTQFQLNATPIPGGGSTGSSDGGIYTDGSSRTITFVAPDSDFLSVLYYANGSAQGLSILGAETRIANLPSTTANYSGLYQFVSSNSAVSGVGSVAIDVNFGGGTVTGFMDDSVGTFATLNGTVVGNGIEGTLDIGSATLVGSVPLEGTFFGPGAEAIGGTFRGNVVSTTAGDAVIVGLYTAD